MKCIQIGDLIYSTKKIKIEFDESVFETVYKNGVFPTQGVRPLISTITNILSSALPTFIYNCVLNDCDTLKICLAQNSFSEYGKIYSHVCPRSDFACRKIDFNSKVEKAIEKVLARA